MRKKVAAALLLLVISCGINIYAQQPSLTPAPIPVQYPMYNESSAEPWEMPSKISWLFGDEGPLSEVIQAEADLSEEQQQAVVAFGRADRLVFGYSAAMPAADQAEKKPMSEDEKGKLDSCKKLLGDKFAAFSDSFKRWYVIAGYARQTRAAIIKKYDLKKVSGKVVMADFYQTMQNTRQDFINAVLQASLQDDTRRAHLTGEKAGQYMSNEAVRAARRQLLEAEYDVMSDKGLVHFNNPSRLKSASKVEEQVKMDLKKFRENDDTARAAAFKALQ